MMNYVLHVCCNPYDERQGQPRGELLLHACCCTVCTSRAPSPQPHPPCSANIIPGESWRVGVKPVRPQASSGSRSDMTAHADATATRKGDWSSLLRGKQTAHGTDAGIVPACLQVVPTSARVYTAHVITARMLELFPHRKGNGGSIDIMPSCTHVCTIPQPCTGRCRRRGR
jgi:hypothetical protein